VTEPATRPAGRFPSRHPRLWVAYLAAGSVALALYYLLPDGPATTLIYQIIGLSAAAALVLGARLHHPARRLPWYLMGLGMAIWSVADLVGSLYGDGFPTPADQIYLVGYPVVAVGIWLLIRGRHQGHDLAGFLDSAILTTSLAVLSWVLLTKPIILTFQDSPLAAVVAVSYPVADIVLAGLLIRLLKTPGGRTRSFRLLVIALITLIAADTASSALDLLTFDSTRPIDFLWLISYLAWGAAALDPSMVSLSAPTVQTGTRFTRKQLVALTVAVLIAPLTLAVQAALDLPLAVWGVVVGSVLAYLLVVARMNLSLEQIQAANAERSAAQAELTHQAAHDSLTGLANRAQALRLISGALSRAQRSGAVVGLLFIDLDGFKQVNDTLGHQAGDEVLKTVARRMSETVRAGDVVARLGGDEFVVLLEPLDEQASGVDVAERVIDAVSEPMLLGSGHEATIGASIGLAISQDGDVDADRLMMEADLAVYRAKSLGRGRTEVFDRALRDRLQRRGVLEDAIRDAIQADAVQLTFDPVVELMTGEPSAFQTQIACPVDGTVADRQSLVDDLGRNPAVVELDTWCLRRATALLAGLGDPVASVSIGVAVTLHHLVQDRVVTDVDRALRESGLSGDRLVLVLAASELSDDLRLLSNLTKLRGRGVRISMDGFGAGAGPTNQWLRLPIASVRLDPALLRDAAAPTPASRPEPVASDEIVEPSMPVPVQLLRLTVQTAHAFGYRVIAPQLDDEVVLIAASEAGCELGQGAAVADLLADHTVEYGPLMSAASRMSSGRR
jgi:diguanylate cyclase (GGDEF)-like protein